MLNYFIKIFFAVLLVVTVSSHATTSTEQSLPSPLQEAPQAEAKRATIWPTTLYLGIDLAKTGYGWHQKTGNAWEISSSIDFSRLLWDMDYGQGSIHRDGGNDGSITDTTGRYFRVGLGWNLLTPTDDHNQFFAGIRYARSWFNFALKGRVLPCDHRSYNDKQGIIGKPTTCIGCTSGWDSWKGDSVVDWWEIVAGGKVRLVHILSIGCTVRYKFHKKTIKKRCTNNQIAEPFDIPGFGFGEYDHAFGCSLYVLLRIPLQSKHKVAISSRKN
ncbi:DUF6048 family protein [Candidatus Cardinium hertigii]|uniref:Uncharacterized protein n=1 Tax=Candidatus Cardinium hertigii TaxID=247481 RepID=A0A2Z3L7F6_9BACT|nr:DUF6048 family protein [Candidatus Cardinium hertigii]AWN81379.1 hypothetical protein DK880_00041 [Candidatus Cardinium hertigii]